MEHVQKKKNILVHTKDITEQITSVKTCSSTAKKNHLPLNLNFQTFYDKAQNGESHKTSWLKTLEIV